MKPNELFNLIKKTDYKKCGLCANYQILVDDKNKLIKILFQESNGFWDWVFNLLYIAVPVYINPYKNMLYKWKVHFGIKIVWHMMRDEVMGQIKQLHKEHSDYKIETCGWSHGGGQADMCAEDIATTLNYTPDDFTFGGLRIAHGKKTKEHFDACLGKNSVKYENGSDLVCRVPFWFMGFKDLSCKKHIGEKFSWFKIFKVAKYHTSYGDETLYK